MALNIGCSVGARLGRHIWLFIWMGLREQAPAFLTSARAGDHGAEWALTWAGLNALEATVGLNQPRAMFELPETWPGAANRTCDAWAIVLDARGFEWRAVPRGRRQQQ